MVKGTLTALIDAIPSEPDEWRPYIGASLIGHKCWRHIWFYRQQITPEPPSLTGKRALEMGKHMESWIISLVKKIGRVHRSLPTYRDDKLPYFQGNPDAIFIFKNKKFILEIKTAKDSSFQQFVKHGLLKWNEQYYAQVQTYMGLSKIKRAIILVLNKNTGKFYDEVIQFDFLYFEHLRTKAQAISESTTAPPKINNSPLFYVCRMCQFKTICHEDTKTIST